MLKINAVSAFNELAWYGVVQFRSLTKTRKLLDVSPTERQAKRMRVSCTM